MKMDYLDKVIEGATIVCLTKVKDTEGMIIECVKDGEPLKINLSAHEHRKLVMSVDADWE